MFGPAGSFGGFFGGAFFLLAAIFWLVLLVLLVLAVRWLWQQTVSGQAPRAKTDALEVLRDRYARGEIDTAEYEERRRALE